MSERIKALAVERNTKEVKFSNITDYEDLVRQ